MKKDNKFNYDKSMKRLEEISEMIESSEIDLDKSLSLYEEGMEIYNNCMNVLENAKQRISTFEREDTDD